MNRWTIVVIACLLFPSVTFGETFSFHELSGTRDGPTLLVIGGVDGDEPGGFHAAATLVTRYRIERGQLWVVPNLNFTAILNRRRGTMNLKFAELDARDPLYPEVQRIKELIARPEVALALNLHDGSGFYHPQRISSRRNPHRWGQCCVIDQQTMSATDFGDLQQLATATAERINRRIRQPELHFQVKNNRTAGQPAAAPARGSLTYFAVRRGVPAMAVEASKEHPVHLRTYYHLLALEAVMADMGIRFNRDFPLTPEGVKQVIADDARIWLARDRIQLDLNQMRGTLDFLPLTEGRPPFRADNPLITLRPFGKHWRIHYGNNRLAVIVPQNVPLEESDRSVTMDIDGLVQEIPYGSIVPVEEHFRVRPGTEQRVNIIGHVGGDPNRDGDVRIALEDLEETFSIDRQGRLYRVEVYRDEGFSGMILVDFRPRSGATYAGRQRQPTSEMDN